MKRLGGRSTVSEGGIARRIETALPFALTGSQAAALTVNAPAYAKTIEAKIEHEGSGFAVTSAKVRVGQELKCSADLTFRHIPFPHPDLRVHMDAMAAKIGFPLQAMTHD